VCKASQTPLHPKRLMSVFTSPGAKWFHSKMELRLQKQPCQGITTPFKVFQGPAFVFINLQRQIMPRLFVIGRKYSKPTNACSSPDYSQVLTRLKVKILFFSTITLATSILNPVPEGRESHANQCTLKQCTCWSITPWASKAHCSKGRDVIFAKTILCQSIWLQTSSPLPPAASEGRCFPGGTSLTSHIVFRSTFDCCSTTVTEHATQHGLWWSVQPVKQLSITLEELQNTLPKHTSSHKL